MFIINTYYKDALVIKKRIFLVSLACISLTCHGQLIDLYLSGGPTYSRLNNNSNPIQIDDVIINQYITNDTTHHSGMGGIGIGLTYDFGGFTISPLLAGYYVNFGIVNGIEYPLVNLGSFDTLNYQFYAESAMTMAEARFTFTRYYIQPYLVVGAGLAWNTLYNYSETPTNPAGSAAAAEPFDSATVSRFAFEGGVGIRVILSGEQNTNGVWYLGLDYRYFNTGSGALGKASYQTTDEKITVSKLATQAAVITVATSLG